MILYFSATGNTKFIAERLAELLGDETVNLLDRIRDRDYSELRSDKPFVVCAPVYICEMPRFMAEYLRKTPLSGCPEVYCVFTSGGYAGSSGPFAKILFRKKGMKYRGHAEFQMPRSYIASNTYPDLEEDEKIRRLTSAKENVSAVAEIIKSGGKLRSRHVWLFEKLITLPFNPIWYYKKQPVRPFSTTDKCVGCGKCESLCPLRIIELKEGRPVWNGKCCAHCMSCIQNCPVEAIEYGQITQVKRRYTYDRYRNKIE